MYVKISTSFNQAQLNKNRSLNRRRMSLRYTHVCQETNTFGADLRTRRHLLMSSLYIISVTDVGKRVDVGITSISSENEGTVNYHS